MTIDEAQQDRVHAYVAEVMRVVSGIPMAEAATTLTVSVAALMIAWSKIKAPKAEREMRFHMADNFTEQLREYLARDEIVEWIQAHTTYAAIPPEQ
jgi:hypothetical protein